MMSPPQTKKQKTEETMIITRHGEDVPLAEDSSPEMNSSSSPVPSSNESGNLMQAMAVAYEHENRVENSANQTHQEHSTSETNHESHIAMRTVTPESKQEPRNGDEKQDLKTKPSWLTVISGHAIDFNNTEYVDVEYPAYGITVSVSEDGSEVDVRNPSYFNK